MITAVDTNVLLDILLGSEEFFDASSTALGIASSDGSLVICDVVYAELCAHFRTQRQCDEFLEDTGIRPEPLSRSASFLASRTWRRNRLQGGKRSRILPDFLIGAHAQLQASRLLSRDRGFYRDLYPSLVLLDPAARRQRL
jgi:predicted nucleic acid-binding protein